MSIVGGPRFFNTDKNVSIDSSSYGKYHPQQQMELKGWTVSAELGSKRKRRKEFNCAVEFSLDFIRGKWVPSILWAFVEKKPLMRFSELKKANPKMNERVLARTLRELENKKLIIKRISTKNSMLVEYELAPLGKSLAPSLQVLCKWGMSNGYKE